MQAVILTAGQSSRFYPFNGVHKSLITIAGKTILEHTILAIKKLNITNIVLIVAPDGAVEKEFENGEKLGVSIVYIIQPEALGAGNALLLSKDVLQEEFFLLNASHVDFYEFAQLLQEKKTEKIDLVLLAKEEASLQQYGILEVKGNIVKSIVEKPEKGKEPSNLRVIGIYLMTKKILFILEKTPAQHYQLETAISILTKEGNVTYVKTEKEIVTLKYPWDLLKMKDYLLNTISSFVSQTAKIANNVEIQGNVYIDDDVTIMEGVCLKGPCYVGKGAFIGNNALLRNMTSVEEKTVVGSMMEMKNVLMMKNSTTHTGLIEDSVIGKSCKIAAGICTANVRLDRDHITTFVKGEKIDTYLTSFGIIMGNGTKTGVQLATMPGIIIGNNVLIGPSTTVMKNIPDNKKYYTKFEEIVEENM